MKLKTVKAIFNGLVAVMLALAAGYFAGLRCYCVGSNGIDIPFCSVPLSALRQTPGARNTRCLPTLRQSAGGSTGSDRPLPQSLTQPGCSPRRSLCYPEKGAGCRPFFHTF